MIFWMFRDAVSFGVFEEKRGCYGQHHNTGIAGNNPAEKRKDPRKIFSLTASCTPDTSGEPHHQQPKDSPSEVQDRVP